MTKLIKFTYAILILFIFACTAERKLFNFETKTIDISNIKEEQIQLKEITTQGGNGNTYAIVDSLLIAYETRLNNWFYIYNLKNNSLIGEFCHKGKGPRESVGLMPIRELYKIDGLLKADVFAWAESKILTWNISTSLKEGRTIIDTIYKLSGGDKNGALRYRYIFDINDSISIAEFSGNRNNNQDISIPSIRVLNNKTGFIKSELILYDKDQVIDGEILLSEDCIKPDKSKYAMCMAGIPQINIIDISSLKVIGYRLQEYTKKHQSENYWFFSSCQSDNNYIYALYYGGLIDHNNINTCPSNLYIFDWKGNLKKNYKLGGNFTEIWLDKYNKRMYFTHRAKGDLFYWDITL